MLRNGDHITGEVRELQSGRLRYKTDDLGTVYIEWLKVDELSSTTPHEVATSDARRFVGRLEARGGGMLAVVGSDTTEVLPHDQVVRISQLDDGFWRRLEGSFDLGLTYTQADQTSQLNFDLDLDQRRPNHQTSIDFSGILTDREEVEATRRADASFTHLRLRRSRWFTALCVRDADQPGARPRSPCARRSRDRPLHHPDQPHAACAAASAWRCSRSGQSEGESDEEVEAFLSGSYRFFTFDYPNTNIDISLQAFHGLSSDGGLRLEADVSIKRELVKDFYFSVGAYDSYDNDPITPTAAENNWGLTTSFGWSF